MTNTVSDYFEDEDLINNLRTFFELEEMWKINFYALLTDIAELNDIYLQLKYKGRVFYIHKLTGDVTEKED